MKEKLTCADAAWIASRRLDYLKNELNGFVEEYDSAREPWLMNLKLKNAQRSLVNIIDLINEAERLMKEEGLVEQE